MVTLTAGWIFLLEEKMEPLARRSNIIVGRMKELEGRMYVEKGSRNVTRIKTGIAIEGNWKKGIVVARTVKSYQWAVDVC